MTAGLGPLLNSACARSWLGKLETAKRVLVDGTDPMKLPSLDAVASTFVYLQVQPAGRMNAVHMLSVPEGCAQASR